ncbi:prodigiosin biosynthesis protein PigM [Pseudoalteromonas rubra]|uniref:Prodigiosin biosynthesis protein PigM n=1 Tax=Pseudoalteromonas rubra TaxID=43658 RepID=A0A5S3X1W4_9GAMM|nr:prodigiosin biosynthesis protein PigM [Pseudoalteromonas rubra]TMP38048.1 prodigiosin biosynthesis protein PigM [Pseudoalteromonas rubra]
MTHTAFEQTLTEAVKLARLAPSSHNCQPWAIHFDPVIHCGYLAIDNRRKLTGLPSLEREMLLSCGIFFYILEALIRSRGYELHWRWCDEQEQQKLAGNDRALIRFMPGPEQDYQSDAFASLSEQLQQRHTVRSPYLRTALSEQQRDELVALLKPYPVSLGVFYQQTHGQALSRLTQTYAGQDFANKAAWRETYSYIRFDERRQYEDGFYLHNLFGPVSAGFKHFFKMAFHPSLNSLTKLLRLPDKMAKGLAELVACGPHYLSLNVSKEGDEAMFRAGIGLGALWLRLQQWGWAMHPISVLVQHDNARQALAECLSQAELPVFFARFGEPEITGSPAPRRHWQSILLSDTQSFTEPKPTQRE